MHWIELNVVNLRCQEVMIESNNNNTHDDSGQYSLPFFLCRETLSNSEEDKDP
jgi:hypothetical protein